jgi:hypothetical protein
MSFNPMIKIPSFFKIQLTIPPKTNHYTRQAVRLVFGKKKVSGEKIKGAFLDVWPSGSRVLSPILSTKEDYALKVQTPWISFTVHISATPFHGVTTTHEVQSPYPESSLVNEYFESMTIS